MRTFAQKPKADRSTRFTGSGRAEVVQHSGLPGLTQDFSRVPLHARGFSSKQDFMVQGRVPPLDNPDPIHGPLLDQYSRDTGLPRDRVTQHDPGYEAWITNRPATPPAVAITLEMDVPGVDPAPSYSRDDTQLGAWEKANILFTAQSFSVCDHTISNGAESSFVTDIGIRLNPLTLQYFIARHIFENMNDRTLDTGTRITWRQIHGRILRHAHEHFVRYRQVVDAMRQTISQRFAAMPTRNNPIQIPQADLEAYANGLLAYLVARLHHELWRTTCDWERADYPTLLRGIPNVGGRFVAACDPEPAVPPEPIMPVVVTPRSSGSTPSRRRH
jgi:hypothetical protein